MCWRIRPISLYLRSPPHGNPPKKGKSDKSRIIDNHSLCSYPPEIPVYTLHFSWDNSLGMNGISMPFRLLHTKRQHVQRNRSRGITRLIATRRAAPARPAITARTCRRKTQSTIRTAYYSQPIITCTVITKTTQLPTLCLVKDPLVPFLATDNTQDLMRCPVDFVLLPRPGAMLRIF
jgi:hypothetical protein